MGVLRRNDSLGWSSVLDSFGLYLNVEVRAGGIFFPGSASGDYLANHGVPRRYLDGTRSTVACQLSPGMAPNSP